MIENKFVFVGRQIFNKKVHFDEKLYSYLIINHFSVFILPITISLLAKLINFLSNL